MNINTNTGALRLTKTEQKLLGNAKSLLLKIGKHGDGDMASEADVAAEAIGTVQVCLSAAEEPATA